MTLVRGTTPESELAPHALVAAADEFLELAHAMRVQRRILADAEADKLRAEQSVIDSRLAIGKQAAAMRDLLPSLERELGTVLREEGV
jgi:hypothetical protein